MLGSSIFSEADGDADSHSVQGDFHGWFDVGFWARQHLREAYRHEHEAPGGDDAADRAGNGRVYMQFVFEDGEVVRGAWV